MIDVAALPDLGIDTQFLFRAEGKTAFDQLNCAFERRVVPSREKAVNVIRHYNKLMEKELLLVTIGNECRDQETSHSLGLKKGTVAVSIRSYEISARGDY